MIHPARRLEGVTKAAVAALSGTALVTVKQTAETLTIQRTMGGDTATLTYQLDGTGSRNTLEGGNGRPVDSLSILKWDGPKLTIVTRQESDGKIAEATQVWTVVGNTLTVESASGRGTPEAHLQEVALSCRV